MISSPDNHPGTRDASAERILDEALALGERTGWDAVHMYELAAACGLGLSQLAQHFAGKDALVERWFDRADAALLAAPGCPGWQKLSPRERLQRALWRWLEALAPHRRLTIAMLRYKLQPDHLHLQALGAMRVSRTVQWLREAAGVPTIGWRRELEEVALTAIYLASFAYWLVDDSPGADRSSRFIDRQLALAERLALCLGTSMGRPSARARRAGSDR
ncbi:MAG: TetR family transcriptional regulator [Rhodocyclaceae bacterium]|nr:TetR family transcriptional regulator [Rhodocyclaceae bacterium]